MKNTMKEIEMIAYFQKKDWPIPLRFRIEEENGDLKVVRIDKILWQKEDKRLGNKMLIYGCKSFSNNIEKYYELKYEIKTLLWYLFKI